PSAVAQRPPPPRAPAPPPALPSVAAAPGEPSTPSGGVEGDKPPTPSAEPDTLVAETQRLRQAHAALKGGDAARALSLLDEQSAVGPQLREERAAGRIFALC